MIKLWKWMEPLSWERHLFSSTDKLVILINPNSKYHNVNHAYDARQGYRQVAVNFLFTFFYYKSWIIFWECFINKISYFSQFIIKMFGIWFSLSIIVNLFSSCLWSKSSNSVPYFEDPVRIMLSFDFFESLVVRSPKRLFPVRFKNVSLIPISSRIWSDRSKTTETIWLFFKHCISFFFCKRWIKERTTSVVNQGTSPSWSHRSLLTVSVISKDLSTSNNKKHATTSANYFIC